MAEPFIGEIRMFGFNFAPQGWALCNGGLLPISQNTALFALLGTQFGGDGRITFALPDLRGRAPLHFGQGPGLSPYDIGQSAGEEAVTLNSNQIPPHGHPLYAASGAGNQRGPDGHVLAQEAAGQTAVYSDAGLGANLRPDSIGAAGGGQPHDNMPPYLVINFCIALFGIFPSRG